jgi:undecaprenyl pyrophosphate phosphatase UppP
MENLYSSESKQETHIVKNNNTNAIEELDDMSDKEDTIEIVKSTALFVATIVFLIIAFETSDIIKSHLFTSLSIITASITFYNLSNPQQLKK